MSNYTKTTDFEAKDSLPSGDSGKIIRGSEFETEFDNIATAIASKSDANNPTFTGTVTIDGLTVNGNTVLGNAATDTVTVTADIASNLLPSADDTYNLGAVGAEWNDLYVDGTAHIDAINFNGTAITATAAELNIMDGVTATTAELNIMDGVTATTAELNIMDGVTATTAELNIMDGVTATTTELNYVDGVTSAIQTQLDSKANLSGANFTGSIDVSGTATMDGLTVDGGATFNQGSGDSINIFRSTDYATLKIGANATDHFYLQEFGSNDLYLARVNSNVGAYSAKFASNGDISFYNSAGTSQSLFWDASEERLGIGTTTPNTALEVADSTPVLRLTNTQNLGNGEWDQVSMGAVQFYTSDTTSPGARVGAEIEAFSEDGASGPEFELVFKTSSISESATERLRIDSSGNVGIGASIPERGLHLKGTINAAIRFQNTANIKEWELSPSIPNVGNTGFSLHNVTDNATPLHVDNSNRVGIGTTSPTVGKLQVNDGSGAIVAITRTSGDTSGNLGVIRFGNTNIDSNLANITAIQDGSTTSSALTFETQSTGGATAERMRIDASGNVQVKGGNELRVYRGDNATYGSIKYLTGSGGLQLNDQNGDGISFVQASGTTEYGRFDSSGNLLVGKTSADVATQGIVLRGGTGESYFSRTNDNPVYINRNTSDGSLVSFRKDGSPVGSIGSEGGNLYIDGNAATGKTGIEFIGSAWYPRNDGANSNGAVDLGDGSNRFKDLYLSGGLRGDTTFKNNAGTTEYARFDSSGNLLVGKTGSDFGTVGAEILPTGVIRSAVGGGSCVLLNRKDSDGTIADFRKDNTAVGSISVTASATAYNTSSDQRLKDNIVDAPSASDDIDAIQVRSFDWKADGSHQKYGMVAQELLTVTPDAVSQGLTEEDMMGVDYSKLVPMLVKEIQSLRARVAQLEGEA